MMTLTLFLSVLTLMTTLDDIESPQTPEDQDVRWIMLQGQQTIEPGRGRRIVFMAGDEEYRSEEALPMLARMMNRHGFECIILFSQDPETGLVEHELDHVLLGETDEQPRANPAEVAEWRWISLVDLQRELQNDPNSYTPWFPIAVEKLLAEGLLKET